MKICVFFYRLLGLTLKIIIENNGIISFIKLKTNFRVNMEDEVPVPRHSLLQTYLVSIPFDF